METPTTANKIRENVGGCAFQNEAQR